MVHTGDEGTSGSNGTWGRALRKYFYFSWLLSIPALCIVGIICTGFYVYGVPADVRWNVLGTSLAIAAAALVAGGILGFLFGLPYTVQGSALSTGGAQYQSNTNLELVSDWLTKIIVGIGLVQIGRALPALSRLAQNLKEPLGDQASSGTFGLALIISYAALGFFYLYLWSRSLLMQEWKDANTTRPQSDAHESARSTALTLVNRQLNSLKGGTPPTQDELSKAIKDVPDSTRSQIFNEAEYVRSSNWRENKPLMALSIPVFRGLIAADTDEQYHQNHGSLGWALKDQVSPNWREASNELTKAIMIRDKSHDPGWKLYEATRALCRIHLINGLPARDPEIASLSAMINSDLNVAQTDQHAKQMIDTNEDIQRWSRPVGRCALTRWSWSASRWLSRKQV
jgi:hypothetical protein